MLKEQRASTASANVRPSLTRIEQPAPKASVWSRFAAMFTMPSCIKSCTAGLSSLAGRASYSATSFKNAVVQTFSNTLNDQQNLSEVNGRKFWWNASAKVKDSFEKTPPGPKNTVTVMSSASMVLVANPEDYLDPEDAVDITLPAGGFARVFGQDDRALLTQEFKNTPLTILKRAIEQNQLRLNTTVENDLPEIAQMTEGCDQWSANKAAAFLGAIPLLNRFNPKNFAKEVQLKKNELLLARLPKRIATLIQDLAKAQEEGNAPAIKKATDNLHAYVTENISDNKPITELDTILASTSSELDINQLVSYFETPSLTSLMDQELQAKFSTSVDEQLENLNTAFKVLAKADSSYTSAQMEGLLARVEKEKLALLYECSGTTDAAEASPEINQCLTNLEEAQAALATAKKTSAPNDPSQLTALEKDVQTAQEKLSAACKQGKSTEVLRAEHATELKAKQAELQNLEENAASIHSQVTKFLKKFPNDVTDEDIIAISDLIDIHTQESQEKNLKFDRIRLKMNGHVLLCSDHLPFEENFKIFKAALGELTGINLPDSQVREMMFLADSDKATYGFPSGTNTRTGILLGTEAAPSGAENTFEIMVNKRGFDFHFTSASCDLKTIQTPQVKINTRVKGSNNESLFQAEGNYTYHYTPPASPSSKGDVSITDSRYAFLPLPKPSEDAASE